MESLYGYGGDYDLTGGEPLEFDSLWYKLMAVPQFGTEELVEDWRSSLSPSVWDSNEKTESESNYKTVNIKVNLATDQNPPTKECSGEKIENLDKKSPTRWCGGDSQPVSDTTPCHFHKHFEKKDEEES